MSKTSDMIYFDNFVDCADCAGRAAKILERVVDHFNRERPSKSIDALPEIEQEDDAKQN